MQRGIFKIARTMPQPYQYSSTQSITVMPGNATTTTTAALGKPPHMDTPNLPLFKHTPIDGGNEIRILILQPAPVFSDPLITYISTRPILPALDGTEPAPLRYSALSYCWGVLHDFKWLTCDHKRMRVTAHIDTMLRYLRRASRPRFLWLDALCINQLDAQEKAAQVQCMGRIYTQADKVHVWLGEAEENDHIEEVYESLREIARSSSHRYAPSRSPVSLKYSSVNALSAFLSRPWFRRRWVLQEVALATDVTVHCGRFKISWEWVRDALSAMHQRSRDEEEQGVELLPVVTAKFVVESVGTLYSQSRNVLDLLWTCHTTKCADERDRLFALYGLRPVMPSYQTTLHSVQLSELCPVTYTRHWSDVYTDFARTMIEEGHGVSVLEHALAFGNLSQQNEDWPSWVPSWNLRRKAIFWTSSSVCRKYPDTAHPSSHFSNAVVQEFYQYGRCIHISDPRDTTISQCHAMLERSSRGVPKNGRLRLMMAQLLSKSLKDAGSTLHLSNHIANNMLHSPTASELGDVQFSAVEVYDVVDRTGQREFGCLDYLAYEDRRVLDHESFRAEVNYAMAGCTVVCFETKWGVVFGLTPAKVEKGDVLCCQVEELMWGGSFGVLMRPQPTTPRSFRVVGGCSVQYADGSVDTDQVLVEEMLIV